MTMRPLRNAVRVLVKIGTKDVEKIAVSHDDETDAIQVLRIVVSDLPASGFTYLPQGMPFDTYEKGQWRRKPANTPKTNDPVEALQAELATGDEQRKKSQPGKADELREAWTPLFTVVSEKLPRELRSGELICWQCMRQAFNDPPPRGIQPAKNVSPGSKCALCGADLRPSK
jgi:hypothetical protein